MVLVGVSGTVGSGKTTILSSLASWAKDHRPKVDGFLALAQLRGTRERGAKEYVLERIATGTKILFAHRDESLSPPYQFNQETLDELESWAVSLAGQPRLSLLILDEFGPLEARGHGHMRYWKSLQKSNPEVMVIAVRDNLVREIEDRLGIPFDVIIEVASPNALEELQSLILHHSDWIRVGQFGAAAGGFEATVGSVLHGARVPMRGLFLSTVQSLIMMYAGDRMIDRTRVVWVPFISGALKALSPSGSRLRPMLAIAVQGVLFSVAVTVFGWNVVGIFSGGWLVGAWAAVQGIALQYLFIGGDLFPAVDTVIHWVAERLHLSIPGIATFIVLWASLWGTVSAITTLLAWLRRHRLPARLSALLSKGGRSVSLDAKTPTIGQALRRGSRDLLRPLFWAPVAVVVIIVVASGSSWEQGIWVSFRAVTVGWIFFSLAHMFDPRKLVSWLRRKGHWGPAMAFSRAFRPGSKTSSES
jgi:nucleoside-triphosphatase THEP1